MDVWSWLDGFGVVGWSVAGSVGVLECWRVLVDVEAGGGCWWESGGEESAYEVVAAACRERERARARESERAIRQIRQKRVQAACLPLTPEAPAFASVTDNTDNSNTAREKRYNPLRKANAVSLIPHYSSLCPLLWFLYALKLSLACIRRSHWCILKESFRK